MVACHVPDAYFQEPPPNAGMILKATARDGAVSTWYMGAQLARIVEEQVSKVRNVSVVLEPFDRGYPALEAG